jgi:ribonuclease HII
MEKAVASLPLKPDILLIDGRVPLNLPLRQRYIIDGDGQSCSIAAASIIAKVTRDKIMEGYAKQYPQYGFREHKGYGTKKHFSALEKFGPTPIHRFTYAPLKDLK